MLPCQYCNDIPVQFNRPLPAQSIASEWAGLRAEGNTLNFGTRSNGRVRSLLPERPVLCRFLDAGGIRPLRTLGWPASKKRQGAKSREAGPAAGSAVWGFQVGGAFDRDATLGDATGLRARGDESKRVEEAFGAGLKGVDGRGSDCCPESDREKSPPAWSQGAGTAKRRR